MSARPLFGGVTMEGFDSIVAERALIAHVIANRVLRGQDVGESLTEQYRDYTERRAAVLADYSASVA